jgi:hypothetical protein
MLLYPGKSSPKFETRQVACIPHPPKKKMATTKIEMSTTMDESAMVTAVLGLRHKARPASQLLQEKVRGLQGILDSTKTQVPNWRQGANPVTASPNGFSRDYRGANNSDYHRPDSRGGDRGESYGRFRRNGSQNEFRQRPSNGFGSSTPGGNMSRNSSHQSLNGSSGGATPETPITPVTPRGPPVRYQSRFKNSSSDIEEKILNRIIRLKLNKFGQSTFNDIREFLFQILGEESDEKVSEFVKDFMYLVFSKAAAEEIYCPLYAQLLCEIGKKHTIIFEEMNRLVENYLEIFEDIDPNKDIADNATFEKHNIEKKYRQGYSQFLAELTALEILPPECLSKIFKTLFDLVNKHARTPEKRMLVDEYVDCLLRMSRVLKTPSEFFGKIRMIIHNENTTNLDLFIHLRDSTFQSLSPKSRFLLMDIQDILNA